MCLEHHTTIRSILIWKFQYIFVFLSIFQSFCQKALNGWSVLNIRSIEFKWKITVDQWCGLHASWSVLCHPPYQCIRYSFFIYQHGRCLRIFFSPSLNFINDSSSTYDVSGDLPIQLISKASMTMFFFIINFCLRIKYVKRCYQLQFHLWTVMDKMNEIPFCIDELLESDSFESDSSLYT